jgi:hypothetical protein
MKKFFLTLIISLMILTPIIVSAYSMQVAYPDIPGAQPTTGLVDYIRYIYLFALGAVGLTAFGVMVYGGILYMMSGANVTSKEEANKWFKGAISGLLLALASYLILSTINPNLVKIKAPELPTMQIQSVYTQKEGDPCVPNQPPFCMSGLECKDQIIIGKDYRCEKVGGSTSQPAQSLPTPSQTYTCSYKCPSDISVKASSSNSPDCASCESYALNECNKNCTVSCVVDQVCIPNVTTKVTP